MLLLTSDLYSSAHSIARPPPMEGLSRTRGGDEEEEAPLISSYYEPQGYVEQPPDRGAVETTPCLHVCVCVCEGWGWCVIIMQL